MATKLKVFISILVIVLAVFAEEDTLKIYHAEPVEIGAEKSVGEAKILADQFRDLSNDNLADGLRGILPADVHYGNKGYVNLYVRGNRGEDIAMFIDGIPLNTAFYGKPDFSFIDEIGFDGVIIEPGAVSSDGAVGGSSVNIITREPSDNFTPRAQITCGTGGLLKTSASVSTPIKRCNIDVAGGYSRREHFNLSSEYEPNRFEDGGARENSDFERYSVSTSIGFELNSSSSIDCRGTYRRGNRGIPSPTDQARYWRFVDWHSTRIAMKGHYKSFDAYAFIDDYCDRLKEYRSESMNDDSLKYDSRLGNLSGGAGLEYGHRIEFDNLAFNIKSGADFKMDDVRRQMDEGEPWEHYSMTNTNFRLSASATYEEEFSASIGGKLSGFFLPDNDRNSKDLSGFAAFDYKPPLPFPNARLEIGNSVRYPTPNELFCSFRGNIDLEPQTSIKHEFGFNGVRPFSYSIAAYIDVIHNYIFSSGRNDQYKNIDGSNARAGAEAEIGFDIPMGFAKLDIDGGAGYIDKINGDESILANIPQVKLIGKFEFTPTVGPVFRAEILDMMSRSDYSGRPLPDYVLLNARLSYAFDTMSFPIELAIGMDNATDVAYEEEPGFPAPGRAFFAGISLQPARE
ncbi:MAG: TonB-dependent receptor [bacterium]